MSQLKSTGQVKATASDWWHTVSWAEFEQSHDFQIQLTASRVAATLHTIELLLNAPATLPARLIPLNLKEREEMHKFVAEHLKRGTIQESKSPYAASFFFIKKKDGKLRPVQDYRPINKWTKKNQNVSPLIPQTID